MHDSSAATSADTYLAADFRFLAASGNRCLCDAVSELVSEGLVTCTLSFKLESVFSTTWRAVWSGHNTNFNPFRYA